MSIIGDIADVIGEVKNAVRGLGVRKTLGGVGKELKDVDARFFERPIDSVARRARKSILYFPLITSESVSPAVAATLARAAQVRAGEYIRLMVTNMDPVEVKEGGKNAIISSLRGASLKDDAVFGEGSDEVAAYVRKHLASLTEANLLTIGTSLHEPLERFLVESRGNQQTKSDLGDLYASASTGENDDSAVAQAVAMLGGAKAGARPSENAASRSQKRVDELSNDPEVEKAQRQYDNAVKGGDIDGIIAAMSRLEQMGSEIRRGNSEVEKRVQAMISRLDKDQREQLAKSLEANKAAHGNWQNVTSFEKVNRFPPLLLDLTVQYTDGNQVQAAQSNIALGVKAVAHIIPSADVITGLGVALQRDSFFLQFLRLTSGEISFVKDFLLNLKVAQARASAKTSRGQKVLETLRRQAEWNSRRSNLVISQITSRGFVPPTATIAVTADEVDQIRSLYGVDFSKPSTVREILKSHNLMGFMIVDESIGLVRVFEDGDDDFDRVPLAELQSRGSETSMKDILTILAKN